MSKRGPISPSEVQERAGESIPEEVFEAFNEAIAATWDGREAVVQQEAVIARILDKMQGNRDKNRALLFAKHWLDVEGAYRAKGWTVAYDKPGYCETYPATFTFSKRAERSET